VAAVKLQFFSNWKFRLAEVSCLDCRPCLGTAGLTFGASGSDSGANADVAGVFLLLGSRSASIINASCAPLMRSIMCSETLRCLDNFWTKSATTTSVVSLPRSTSTLAHDGVTVAHEPAFCDANGDVVVEGELSLPTRGDLLLIRDGAVSDSSPDRH
jgi:hypothetical protein